jgi:hypothetical protein
VVLPNTDPALSGCLQSCNPPCSSSRRNATIQAASRTRGRPSITLLKCASISVIALTSVLACQIRTSACFSVALVAGFLSVRVPRQLDDARPRRVCLSSSVWDAGPSNHDAGAADSNNRHAATYSSFASFLARLSCWIRSSSTLSSLSACWSLAFVGFGPLSFAEMRLGRVSRCIIEMQ